MRNAYHKPQHEVFIRCMRRHGDATRAYRTAYPKASKASARTAGLRLYNSPHIRQRIEPVLQQYRAEAYLRADQQAAEQIQARAARRYQIRSVICAIANRQIKKNRYFRVDGKAVVVQEDVSHAAIINLIALDRKLAECYDNWPSIERQFEQLTRDTSPILRNDVVGNSPLEGGRQCGALTGGCRVTRAENTHVTQTSPSAPFKGGTTKNRQPSESELVNTFEKTNTKNEQQTVTNSPGNPMPASLTTYQKNQSNHD